MDANIDLMKPVQQLYEKIICTTYLIYFYR